MGGAYRMHRREKRTKFYLENLRGRRDHWRPRCRWKDIKMCDEIKCEDVDWTGLDASGSGQRPVAGCCEHGNGPSCSIKGGEFCD